MNIHPVESGVVAPPAAVTPAAPVRTDLSAPSAAEAAREGTVAPEEVRAMVAEIQEQIDTMHVNLSFTTYGEHEEHVAVVVTDRESGEVIREIPAREIRDLYQKMSDLAGVIFNRQV